MTRARHALCLAAFGALAASLAIAGTVPRAIVGDWSCDGTRLVLTRLGSIEVLREGGYRAGLFEAQGDELAVTWDGGGSARLSAVREGADLIVRGFEAPLRCKARG